MTKRVLIIQAPPRTPQVLPSTTSVPKPLKKVQKTKTIIQNIKDCLGVIALIVIAIMVPVTESQSSRGSKQPLKSPYSNKIKVLVPVDSGSNEDLYFQPKRKDKPFSYLITQMPKS